MSANAQPITSARFADALQQLPISNLYSTAAEIRNSRKHLQSSNRDLKPHADAGDQVCKEAVDENEEVIERMRQRLSLLEAEVERRGMPWKEDEVFEGQIVETNGNGPGTANRSLVNGQSAPSSTVVGTSVSGSLPDQELRQRMEEQLGSPDDDNEHEDGVHL